MTSVVPNRSLLQVLSACVLGLTITALMCCALRAAEPTADKKASEKKIDLTGVPTVKWLPKPIAVPNADAKTQDEMKAYTEPIPGTEEKIDMVPIPGGKFTMGSPDDEEDREKHEGPQHEVSVEPFWMGKCEITWGQYEQWSMGLDVQRRKIGKVEPTSYDNLADALTRPTMPYSDMTFEMGKTDRPAICMTQIAAQMYCKWLSAKTGRYYRVPTEAEWEYAARAGTKTAYFFGDDADDLDDYAWYFDNSDEKYQKVGTKKANPWGLHDMHGNVCEWVLDKFDTETYKGRAGKSISNPLVLPKELYPRCARGGSWDDDPEALRSAARRGSNKDWKMQDPQIPQSIWYHTDADFLGFRIVRPLHKPSVEESKKYEPDYEVIKEYTEAQSGKE